MPGKFRTLAIGVSVPLLCLVFQTILYSQETDSHKPQQTGPKIEPAAMGGAYNPLLWRGDDADFATELIHDSFCETDLSKVAQSKGANPDVVKLAADVAHTQGKINRQLLGMARTIHFPNAKPPKDAPCPGGDHLMELSGPAFDLGYVDYLSKTYATDISLLENEKTVEHTPANSDLRMFAGKTLPTLQNQQQTITAVKSKLAPHK